MIDLFRSSLSEHFPFLQSHSTILIAVSGGVDSVVLVDLFVRRGYNISLAHCNFKLRESESEADALFVSQLAKTYNLPYFEKSFDTLACSKSRKTSIQVTARDLRYEWFYDLLNQHKIDYLGVAHHLDDSIETFFINFGRGTGLSGLLGIPPVNHKIIRPLWAFSKKEILEYATDRQLKWREDCSNKSSKYLRNKIRHEIIPRLKGIFPDFKHTFLNTTLYLKDSLTILQNHIQDTRLNLLKPYANGYKISIEELLKLTPLRTYLKEIFSPYGFTQYDDICTILHSPSGRQLYSKSHRLIKDRTHLLLVTHPNSQREKKEQYLIQKSTHTVFTPHFQLSLEDAHNPNLESTECKSIYVDSDKLHFPMTLRKWQQGDFFHPFGMKGKKKLSKFFKDERYSIVEKESQWLLCSGDNIVWIIGKRADERFKVSKKSSSVLKIVLIENNHHICTSYGC